MIGKMKSTDILNTLLAALEDTNHIKSLIKDIDTILSGPIYEKFMSAEITSDMLPEIIIGATPVLEMIYFLTDKTLAELTPDLRARILVYLDRCQELYNTAVSILKDKVQSTVSSPKRLEEMSREELLEYIKEQLKD